MAGDKQVSWGIDVKTGESDAQVESLAKALDGMRQSMKTANAEIADMQKAYVNLRKGGDAFRGEAAAMKKALDERRAFVAATQVEFLKLGGKMGGGGGRPRPPGPSPQDLSESQQAFAALRDSLMETNTMLGRLTKSASDFAARMSAAKLMVVAMTVALVAASAAAAVYTSRLFSAALAAQDARRSEYLHLEALTRQRTLYTRVTANAKEMQSAIDRVSASVSVGRGEVTQLATQLHNAGVRGKTFDTVLEAAAIKASALGSSAGAAFAGFAVDLQRAGGSATRAAQDIKNRFGDVVQAKMKSLDVQAVKLAESYGALFGQLDIEPLLDANKAWNDMFAITTETGKALRSFTTAFLQPIIGAVESLWTLGRRFFKQMLIGALELGIMFRTLKLAWIRIFGAPESREPLSKWIADMGLGRIVTYALAVGLTILSVRVMSTFVMWAGRSALAAARFALSLIPLAVNAALVAWPFVLAAAAIWGLYSVTTNLYALWKEIDWSGLGKSIWQGIVKGLKGGWAAIKTVASDLADELKRAFKGALGISSPSKVFAELGLQIPRGVQAGIVAGSPGATSAARNVVQPPPAIGAMGAAARGGGSSLTVTIGSIPITIEGDVKESTAKDLGNALRRELETVLAGLAEQIGAPRTGAA